MECMESLISLRYPNGRVHEEALETSSELRPGYEFDLYGRHWSAVALTEVPRSRHHVRQRLLCVTPAGPPRIEP